MSDMDYEVAHGIAQIENAKLRAEIERLKMNDRDKIIDLCRANKLLHNLLDNRDAEVARAGAALDFMEKRALHKEQEIERLTAALRELLSGHDNLYIAHFGPTSNPHDDIAAMPARRALEGK